MIKRARLMFIIIRDYSIREAAPHLAEHQLLQQQCRKLLHNLKTRADTLATMASLEPTTLTIPTSHAILSVTSIGPQDTSILLPAILLIHGNRYIGQSSISKYDRYLMLAGYKQSANRVSTVSTPQSSSSSSPPPSQNITDSSPSTSLATAKAQTQ